MQPLTLGVEEEFQVCGPDGTLTSRASEVIDALAESGGSPSPGSVLHEMPASQVETVTGICADLDEVRAQVTALRSAAAGAAAAVGLLLLGSGTPVAGDPAAQHVSVADRYAALLEHTGLLARQQFIAGLHVHVGLPGVAGVPTRPAAPGAGLAADDARTAVVDGLRAWLPVLTALCANSPSWFGEDTGFAGYRTVHWSRWAVTGAPPRTRSGAGWDEAVDSLVRAGAIVDPTFVYWDARVSRRFPTVEVRCPDVLADPSDVVAVAGLVRALAATSLRRAREGREPLDPSPEVLRASSWHAARYGLTGTLVHPVDGVLHPAPDVVEALLAHVSTELAEAGDEAVVTTAVERLVADCGPAQRQRRALADGGTPALVELLAVR